MSLAATELRGTAAVRGCQDSRQLISEFCASALLDFQVAGNEGETQACSAFIRGWQHVLQKKKKGPLDESIVDFRLLKAPNYSGVLWELL